MAELIKIDNPDMSIMEDTMTEDEVIDTFNKLKVIVESDDWKSYYKYYFKEDYDSYVLNENPILIAGVGAIAVIAIIHSLMKWIRNKYRLTAQKLLNQSKELNDIYTKVNDILAHDKLARFKHRNDSYAAEVHYCVMVDKKNPNKVYEIIINKSAYNPDFFVEKINEIMRYADTKVNKERTETISSAADSLVTQIREDFMKVDGYTVICDPFMKIVKYPNSKLENTIMAYKTGINNIYNVIAYFNQIADYQLKDLQLVELAYKKMLTTYAKDPAGKEAVDKIFKEIIKNITTFMDFNSRSLVIFEQIIKWYSDELHKIYDIIRS